MREMFTTKPDEGCREVEKGIYGRPVHTSEQSKLRKAGWSYSIDLLRGTSDVRQEKEGREEGQEVTIFEEYEARFGKKPHHKMKAETIRQKLESDDD